jgi:anti-sigma B factor antagonist
VKALESLSAEELQANTGTKKVLHGQIVTERSWNKEAPMKMTANTRLVNGVTIVDLSGRIVLGDGSAGLRDLVHNLVSEGNKKILLNFRNVDYIDSSGLGELVSSLTKMRSQGGELKLLNLTKRVQALLQIRLRP